MTKRYVLPLALLLVASVGARPAHAQLGKLGNLKGMMGKKEAPAAPPAEAEAPADANYKPVKGSAAPTWRMKFARDIAWQKLTPAGVYVVSCPDALYGIDPQTGEQKWKFEEFNGLAENNFDPIPGSPFVAVADKIGGKGLAKLGTKYIILDVYTGKAVVDTKALGLTSASKRAYVPELGLFLLFGNTAEGSTQLIATDASTGAEKWRVDIDKKGKEMAVSQPYLVDGGKAFLWATNLAMYKLDATTGRTLWRTASLTTDDATRTGAAVAAAAAPKESAGSKMLGSMNPLSGVMAMGSTLSMFSGKAALDAGASARATYSSLHFLEAPQSPGRVFVFSDDYLTAFDLGTGKEIWEREPLKSPISNIIYNDRGLLVATSEFDDDAKNNGKLRGGLSRVNLYNYTTGNRMWGKNGVETDGTVSAYSFNGPDFIIATSRASGRNRLDIINLDKGESKLKRALTVDGSIRRVLLVPKGLLYITDQEMNILNLETGKDDWAKSVKFDKEKGVVTALKGDKCYLLSGDKLLVLDTKTADYKVLADRLTFEGKEYPSDFELLPTGLVLKSSQNLQFIDYAGKPGYRYFTPGPGRSLAGKIFFGTMGVLNAAAGAAAAGAAADEGYRAGASGYGTTSYNEGMARSERAGNLAGGFAEGAGQSFREMNKRFKASRDGTQLVTMLTMVKDANADTGVGIKMIDKRTGQESASLILDNKKPEYVLDDIGRMVFYKAASNELYGYKF